LPTRRRISVQMMREEWSLFSMMAKVEWETLGDFSLRQ
jgi:hypothetical protein